LIAMVFIANLHHIHRCPMFLPHLKAFPVMAAPFIRLLKRTLT